MRKATFPYITYNYPKNTSIFIFLNSRKYGKTNQSLKESLKSEYSSFSLEPIPTCMSTTYAYSYILQLKIFVSLIIFLIKMQKAYLLCIYIHIYMRPTWNMTLYTPKSP